MKKTNRLLGSSILLAVMLLFISCQKEVDQIPVNTTAEISNQAVITKINSWLENKKVGLADDLSSKIERLKTNLDFGTLHLEKYKQKDRLVIVPLKNSFKSANNEDKNPVNYLVVVLPEQGDITKGNIIQYVSATGKNKALLNAFSKIFNFEELDCNGQFTVLSITDDFRYELKFENNKLKSIAELRTKPGSDKQKTNGCIEWYLVTTYHYSDGSSESYWQYVFTSCDCEQVRNIDCRRFRINCGGGSGGGGDIEYEEEYTASGTLENAVYWFAQVDGGGTLKTTQILYAKFYKIHTEKDKITSCYLVRSDVFGNSLGATAGINTYNVSNLGASIINAATNGTIKYPNGASFQFDNTTAIHLGDIAWHR
jgi:hypothetical protein